VSYPDISQLASWARAVPSHYLTGLTLHTVLTSAPLSLSSIDNATAPSLNLQAILGATLADYSKQTGKDLENNPLAVEIRQCKTPGHILSISEMQAEKSDEFRNGDSKLMKYLNPVVDGLHALSNNAAFSAGVSLVSSSVLHDWIWTLIAYSLGIPTRTKNILWHARASHRVY
jgi:hypothetical protein